MPDLNIKGNILEDFGAYLPTPIIDTVNVYNDYMEVGVSLYINFSDPATSQEDINEYMTSMENSPIYVYVARVIGKEIIEKLVSTENPDIFGALYSQFIDSSNGDTTTTTRLQSAAGDEIKDMRSNYAQLQFTTQDFTLSTQNFYDDQNNRVFQFTTTFTLPISFVVGDGSTLDFGSSTNYHKSIMGDQEGLADSLRELTIFAFTSIMDLNSAETSNEDLWSLTGYTMSDNLIHSDSYKLNLMPHVATQVVSNIAYEPVYKDGVIDSNARLAYVDSDGGTYNDTPIQAINGKLYKQDGYSLEQVVALFKTYVSETKTDDNDIENILNNISYILSTYGTSSELLIQLNTLRKAFPNKSTATAAGRLYSGFKDRFFGANEKVVSGTPVSEQLYKSSKVKGYTDLGDDTNNYGRAGSGEMQEPYAHNFIYIYKEGDSTEVERGDWMSSVQVYREAAYGNPMIEEFIKSGFWFFDYTWAFKQYAVICDFFKLSELKYILNDFEIYEHFKLKEVQMQSWLWPVGTTEVPAGDPTRIGGFPMDINDYEWKWTLTAPIGYGDAAGVLTGIEGAETHVFVPYIVRRSPTTGDPDQHFYGHTLEVANGVDVDTDPDKTFIIPRGLQGTLIDDSHGLVCFQFQETEPYPGYEGGAAATYDTPDDRSVYTFQVTVEDTSVEILDQIVESFVGYFTGAFKDYYDLAQENCNYNQQDGTFNEFFKEGIMEHYGDNEAQYPWIRMPLLFTIHSRLMTTQSAALGNQAAESAFGEDPKTEAARIAGTINPINGSLDSLKAFYERCQSFLDNFYGEGTPMANALEGQLHPHTGEAFPTTTIIRGPTNTTWTSGNEYLWSAPPPPLSTVEGAGWTYEPPEPPVPEPTWPPDEDWYNRVAYQGYWKEKTFMYYFGNRFQISGGNSELEKFAERMSDELEYWDSAYSGNPSGFNSYAGEAGHDSATRTSPTGMSDAWYVDPGEEKDYQGAFDILTEWLNNNDTGNWGAGSSVTATHLGVNVDRNRNTSVPNWANDPGGHPRLRVTPYSREWLVAEIRENDGYVRITQYIWNDAVSAFNDRHGFPSDVGLMLPTKFAEEYPQLGENPHTGELLTDFSGMGFVTPAHSTWQDSDWYPDGDSPKGSNH
jgi:hypothetical protein